MPTHCHFHPGAHIRSWTPGGLLKLKLLSPTLECSMHNALYYELLMKSGRLAPPSVSALISDSGRRPMSPGQQQPGRYKVHLAPGRGVPHRGERHHRRPMVPLLPSSPGGRLVVIIATGDSDVPMLAKPRARTAPAPSQIQESKY